MIITKENINDFTTGYYPDVTRLVWKAGPLDPLVLSNFPNLLKLKCAYNQLESLAGIDACPSLQNLDCSINNLVSLKGIENCLLLVKLECSWNRLEDLSGLEGCPMLVKLSCHHNRLSSIAHIQGCRLLTKILCYVNGITSLAGIENCSLLQELDCINNSLLTLTQLSSCNALQILVATGNRLQSLTGIEGCPNLEILECDRNHITTLAGLEHCLRIRILNCSHNEIQELGEIVYLRQLRSFHYSYNPIMYQNIQVQRFIDGIVRVNTKVSIYTDGQNVHDVCIQKTVCDSIKHLLSDGAPDFTIEAVLGSSLSTHTKERLAEYCADSTIHSVHLLTYAELLAYVWARMCRSEHKSELLRIFEEQIVDSECMCFTGRFNRTLSVLVGFYDDIVIEISDRARIGAIIIALKTRINPYDPIKHAALAIEQLRAAGYDDDTIQPWVDAIE